MAIKLSVDPIVLAGLTLGTFALLSVLLLAGTQWLTQDRIADNVRRQNLKQLHAIIDKDAYDNELIESVTGRRIGREGLAATARVYRATLNNAGVAQVFEVTSLEGYSGAIKLLIGINADHTVRGVRVTAHKETPGLGDKIETRKADWIVQFAGKSLTNPPLKQWRVKKEGGAFDQFTGATITPRAVVNAVRETLMVASQGGMLHE